MKHKLPLPEQNDFYCLLSLMPALHQMPEYSWLPEMYSIIDEEALTTLCAVAGGETIRIPTLAELEISINALEWYYDVYIAKRKQKREIPEELKPLVNQIYRTFSEEGEQYA